MPTQRIISLLLLSGALFACNNNKEHSRTDASNYVVAKSTPNYSQSSSYEMPNLLTYQDDFLQGSIQRFKAPARGITVLTGRKGLKVKVDPAALEKADGSAVDGPVIVDMAELTDHNDFFKSNAATICDGQLLASGGSYFIAMHCGEKELRIRDGRTIEVELPQFKKEDMQLFYGSRDENGDMSWESAGQQLRTAIKTSAPDEDLFTQASYMGADFLPDFALDENKQAKIYKTLKEEIYYYNRKMSIKEIVDTINRYRVKLVVDTVYMWPKSIKDLPPGTYVDSNYLYAVYGPTKQFVLKTCHAMEAEKNRNEKIRRSRDSALSNWQPQYLAGQLQKYYSPTKIARLGWLNCDRFYKYEKSDQPLELPVTLNNSKISYFIMYPTVNGMMNGRISVDDPDSAKLTYLPVNIKATLVAFTRINGAFYHCKKENFMVGKEKLKLDFTVVSADEMRKMFGKNVKI